MDMTWDPEQYMAFADQRLRPALELLQRVPLREADRVVDLGCGTGNVTRHLRKRWPNASIVGVDSSREMLATAARQMPEIFWRYADIADWKPEETPDLIYSNATLHWIEDHATFLPRLVGFLKPGGALAVQMPRNFEEPSHTLMFDAAERGPWALALREAQRRIPVVEPDYYYNLLAPIVKELDIWETQYQQVLEGDNPVAEFTKGTWLKPLLDALEEPLRSQFEEEYRRLVSQAYPTRPDGKTLFPFRRLFIVATV